MKRLPRTSHILLYLTITALFVLGCGLFNSAVPEQQEIDEELVEGTTLGRVVTARGIGNKNNPVGITDTFSASHDFIYVVAEADRIEQGTTMFVRWLRDGEPFEVSTEITADQDYENTYIQFHLENSGSEITIGNYSVQFFVNGNPIEEVAFKVQ